MSKKLALPACDNCGGTDQPLMNCSRCKLVHYCGKECQRQHWKNGHKGQCVEPKDRVPAAEAEVSTLPKCVICLAAFKEEAATFTKADIAVKLTCGHKFHELCLISACRAGDAATCPCCRKPCLSGESLYEVNYKNLLLGKRIFIKFAMPYTQESTIRLAEKKLGEKASAKVQNEVSAISDADLFEKAVTCQFLCQLYLLR